VVPQNCSGAGFGITLSEVVHGPPAPAAFPLETSVKLCTFPNGHYISAPQKDKTPTIASEGFLILVGQKRFELATNGPIDVKLTQTAGL